MPVAISSIVPTTPEAVTVSEAASNTAEQALSENFDLFLALLTTQLQNQNPLDPMDTSEMTSQIVQFTSVEQTIATNSNLETLIALNRSQSSENSVEYIGKEVEALSQAAKFAEGETTEWRYSVAEDSPEVTLTIVDSNGSAVHVKTISADEGTHAYSWDGSLDKGGTASNGTYFLSVTAVDEGGDTVQTDVRIVGIVDSVDFTVDPPALLVNSIPVRVTDVTTVTARPSSSP